jgi:hypothetical protein
MQDQPASGQPSSSSDSPSRPDSRHAGPARLRAVASPALRICRPTSDCPEPLEDPRQKESAPLDGERSHNIKSSPGSRGRAAKQTASPTSSGVSVHASPGLGSAMPAPGVSPSRPTPPASCTGAAAIFRAVPPGSRRCRSQREWLRVALAEIEAAGFYSNRAHHYAGICRILMQRMNWTDRTSRPGHLSISAAEGVSPDTVARAVAWLRERGLLGLVSPGTTAMLRPGVLYAGTANLAAVYVLTVPRRRSQARSPVAGKREFADLTSHRRWVVSGPCARQAKTPVKTGKARPTGGLPMLPRASPALHHCPRNRSEGLAAAQAVQERARDLRRLSAEHVRWLGRPFFAAGWTPADVVHAIDHSPTGRPHGFTAGIRSPGAWARARLALWLGPDGVPLPSRSQLAAEHHRQVLAEQERLRAERRPPDPAGYARGAARAREALRQALAAASAGQPRPAGSRLPSRARRPARASWSSTAVAATPPLAGPGAPPPLAPGRPGRAG